jgi:hypothetical protein
MYMVTICRRQAPRPLDNRGEATYNSAKTGPLCRGSRVP